ncbi:head-tail connector protein [Planctomycetes bacterium TBK1r]|uniref:Phage gp6-like head-tail connector protein n=1 Tax=Stieleria magnilauensis TaxID=2527963 RepID=A0ABX5XY23_9BACT|nr:Phage gp6-like head-tail connector protein [Planctomycetes bacterium TBK1r]QDV87001.1 Phage gp6-like head-tail connector protein [Planctomycetes bacterium TBK1r]
MSTTTTTGMINGRLRRTVAPAAYPVSVADAKKQLEIATDDTAHDDQLTELIAAATEQWEHDTQYVCVSSTYEYLLDCFPAGSRAIRLPVRPVTSLTSVTYLDGSSSETLATTVADLDRKKDFLALKYEQEWPSITTQTDAIVITFEAGYAASQCPRFIRRAILLQVAKWFEDRDMMLGQTEANFDIAYERIARKLGRSSYP